VYLEESRLLLVRYWWLLALFSLTLLLWVHWPMISFLRSGATGWYLDVNHDFIWPVPIFLHPTKLFMLATAVLWAMLIWSDKSPDRRSSFWSMPVSRLTHHSAHVIPGAILQLFIYLIVWYTGVTLTSIFGEVRGLVAGFLPSLPFVVLGVSLLNLYLFSSLICLRFQRPYRCLLLYIPVSVLIVFGMQLLLDMQALKILFSPLMPPYGILGGLGISLWDRMGDTVSPVFWVPFLWFGIISAGLYFVASRHQEP